jgi:hypothetical protein
MYTLILWTLGCTAVDGVEQCPAGDYLEMPKQYTSRQECDQDGNAWRTIQPDNRHACVYEIVRGVQIEEL